MKKQILMSVFVALALASSYSAARAWPAQAPTKATISGPGLEGTVNITDPQVLDALKMGGLEDLSAIETNAPQVSNGYVIHRWFEDGEFQFADLTYYPGDPSHVYFQDGPDLVGDHTPYNNHWLRTTRGGDAALKEFLRDPGTAKMEMLPVRAGSVPMIFDAVTLQPRFILPEGILSADGTAYFAAFPSVMATAVHRFDLNDGSVAQSFSVDGAWSLARVSANGKWLVLTRAAEFVTPDTTPKRSEFVIANAELGRVARTISIDGSFDADGIDASGKTLYLIEHLPDRYQVRSYDINSGQLDPGRLVDKRETDEIMVGYPWDAVAEPQGDWLLTLYINTDKGAAFIHALNLRDKYAFCIDLPPGKAEQALLKHYGLALSPDQRTLFAIDPALGVVSLVDFQDGTVTRTVQFPIAPAVTDRTVAVASADGKLVYFTNGGRVWQLDVKAGQVKQIAESDKLVVALNTRAGDAALYVTFSDHTMQKLDQQAAPTTAELDKCPVTLASAQPFVPPPPWSRTAPSGGFWWGDDKLWTILPNDGIWKGLPHNPNGYSQKLPWWNKDYNWQAEPLPALQVTGRRLDGDARPLLVSGATNGYEGTYKSFMLVGADFPTGGCWQITGTYHDKETSYVVWVEP